MADKDRDRIVRDGDVDAVTDAKRLVITPWSGDPWLGDCYELVESFGEIPEGFVTDGGSIPRLLWRVFGHPFEARYIECYAAHDWDYANGLVKRVTADRRLRAGLAAHGMGFVRRNLIYLGVRIFGFLHYTKNPENERSDSHGK